MTKYYVCDLSLKSQHLFAELAKQFDDMSYEDIEAGISSKVEDLIENEKSYGFRHCNNPNCKEFFQEGYLTKENKIFCSKACAETVMTDIEENDYSTFIFYTTFRPEM